MQRVLGLKREANEAERGQPVSSSWVHATPMQSPPCVSLLPVCPNGLPLSNSPTIARRLSSPNFSLKSLLDSQCSVPASLPPAPYYQLPSARLPHPKPCASLLVFPSPPRSHFGPSVQFLVPVSPSVLKPKYQLISSETEISVNQQ